MTVFQTSLSTTSEAFAANKAAMEAQMRAVADEAERIMLGGSQVARERHVKRGKLLPRDRITGLLDPGSPFLEIGLFAA
jgi:3-methylcrotonyl-CoA carboxylase beta subunit